MTMRDVAERIIAETAVAGADPSDARTDVRLAADRCGRPTIVW